MEQARRFEVGLLDIVGVERRAVPRVPEAVASASNPDLPGLGVAADLKTLGGDTEKYGKLLRQFASLHGDAVAKARRLFSTGNTQGSAQLVHDLRGIACFLRAREVARLAADTEDALRAWQPATQQLNELQVATCATVSSIELFNARVS